MKRHVLFWCALFCAFSCLPLASLPDSGAVVLTMEQVSAIRKDLESIQNEVLLLKALSQELTAESDAWKNKCSLLETQLTQALQELASSSETAIELQKKVGALRNLLEELKSDYAALNRLYLKQKKTARLWRTVAVTFILISVGEGMRDVLSR